MNNADSFSNAPIGKPFLTRVFLFEKVEGLVCQMEYKEEKPSELPAFVLIRRFVSWFNSAPMP